jgi:hypothetical protein
MAEVHRKHGGIVMDVSEVLSMVSNSIVVLNGDLFVEILSQALERRSLKKHDSFEDMGGERFCNIRVALLLCISTVYSTV